MLDIVEDIVENIEELKKEIAREVLGKKINLHKLIKSMKPKKDAESKESNQ